MDVYHHTRAVTEPQHFNALRCRRTNTVIYYYTNREFCTSKVATRDVQPYDVLEYEYSILQAKIPNKNIYDYFQESHGPLSSNFIIKQTLKHKRNTAYFY